MDKWSEMRTAYLVAQLGTVSAAAERLGVHRATVVRHIDVLEAEMGGKLFQRHARGYTPTEAGRDLLRVTGAVEEQFHDLADRTRSQAAKVSGELVVTSIPLVAPLIMTALVQFRVENPEARVRYKASGHVYKLEYGEAHVAVRSGARPEALDNVAQPFLTLRSGLYAHADYVARYGLPKTLADYADHAFIGDSDAGSPLITAQWLRAHAPEANVVFSSANGQSNALAVMMGMGIGFYPELLARRDPQLIEVHPPEAAWDVPLWLVTHVDLHWTPRVQAILKLLKQLSDVSPRPVASPSSP